MVATGLYVLLYDLYAFTKDSEEFLLKSVSFEIRTDHPRAARKLLQHSPLRQLWVTLLGGLYMISLSVIYKLMRPVMCKNRAMLRRDQELLQNNPQDVKIGLESSCVWIWVD